MNLASKHLLEALYYALLDLSHRHRTLQLPLKRAHPTISDPAWDNGLEEIKLSGNVEGNTVRRNPTRGDPNPDSSELAQLCEDARSAWIPIRLNAERTCNLNQHTLQVP